MEVKGSPHQHAIKDKLATRISHENSSIQETGGYNTIMIRHDNRSLRFHIRHDIESTYGDIMLNRNFDKGAVSISPIPGMTKGIREAIMGEMIVERRDSENGVTKVVATGLFNVEDAETALPWIREVR